MADLMARKGVVQKIRNSMPPAQAEQEIKRVAEVWRAQDAKKSLIANKIPNTGPAPNKMQWQDIVTGIGGVMQGVGTAAGGGSPGSGFPPGGFTLPINLPPVQHEIGLQDKLMKNLPLLLGGGILLLILLKKK